MSPRRTRLILISSFVAIASLLAHLAWTAIWEVRADAIASTCKNNLFQLRLGMTHYRDANSGYPSLADSSNGPPVSWRMQALGSYSFEYREMYADYRRNEPWNSPHNLKVAAQYWPAGQCPRGPNNGSTSYAALLDKPDEWMLTKENHPILVEVPTGMIGMFEPRDITIAEFKELLSSRKFPDLHRGLMMSNVTGSGKLVYNVAEFETRLNEIRQTDD